MNKMNWSRAREIVWAIIFILVFVVMIVDTVTRRLVELREAEHCGESQTAEWERRENKKGENNEK